MSAKANIQHAATKVTNMLYLSSGVRLFITHPSNQPNTLGVLPKSSPDSPSYELMRNTFFHILPYRSSSCIPASFPFSVICFTFSSPSVASSIYPFCISKVLTNAAVSFLRFFWSSSSQSSLIRFVSSEIIQVSVSSTSSKFSRCDIKWQLLFSCRSGCYVVFLLFPLFALDVNSVVDCRVSASAPPAALCSSKNVCDNLA